MYDMLLYDKQFLREITQILTAASALLGPRQYVVTLNLWRFHNKDNSLN